MAFSDTDKDCLTKAHNYLTQRANTGQIDATEAEHLATIVHGDESAKILVAKWFAAQHCLPAINARLSVIDAEKTALEADQTDLNAYIA